MAQWSQQFSGKTHGAKMQDIEASLRKAVSGLSAATSVAEKSHKEKAVHRLCERLLESRLKILRVRISGLTVAKSKGGVPDERIARLKMLEQELRNSGMDGILKEFSVPNPVSD